MDPENNQTCTFNLGIHTYVVSHKAKEKKGNEKGMTNIKVWIVVTFVGKERRYNYLGA